MRRSFTYILVCTLLLVLFTDCGDKPLPSEVGLAEAQEHELWRKGADIYAPEEYAMFKADLGNANQRTAYESSRWSLLRDYDSLARDYRVLLERGRFISNLIDERAEISSVRVKDRSAYYENRLKSLRKLGSFVNEGRLSRADITKAELKLMEAGTLFDEGKFMQADAKLDETAGYIESAETALKRIYSRFTNTAKLYDWKRWSDETIAASKKKGSYAIVVAKLERKLFVYKNGIIFKKYNVGIGKNGSFEKVHEGDNATPEGKYRVVSKNPRSAYRKALVLNYPSDEDRQRFSESKNKGMLPRTAKIGGLIEIHGGGKDGMTYGCIALDNRQIDELYSISAVDTPVTIVGTLDVPAEIASILKEIDEH